MLEVSTFVKSFIDPEKALSLADKQWRKAANKFGAFTRRRAQFSIRKRKSSSRPGEPPHSHVGTLKKLILFGYDGRTRSVVIGPALFRSGSTVPQLLEFGGTATIREKRRIRVARYLPRPFMKPAFDAEAPNMDTILKGLSNG